MPEANRRIVEQLLADFLAWLYIEEHPEVFRRRTPVPPPQAAEADRAGLAGDCALPSDTAQAGQGFEGREGRMRIDEQKGATR